MAKTIVLTVSIGTDLITIALVPARQSADTWQRRSAPLGSLYTFSEYCAARQIIGHVGMKLWYCEQATQKRGRVGPGIHTVSVA